MDFKKILIIKLAAIGDVIFASPLISNLKANFSDSQIHWLGDSWTKPALSNMPHLDKVFFYDRPWQNHLSAGLTSASKKGVYPQSLIKIKSYIEIPSLIFKLRKEKYDLAIIPHRSGLAFKLARLAGIPTKVGFYEEKPNSDLDINVKYDYKKHEVERNLDLLRGLKLPIKSNKMLFELETDLVSGVNKKILSDLGDGPNGQGRTSSFRRIVIGPGGGKNPGLDMPLKRWPKESYAQLAKKLTDLRDGLNSQGRTVPNNSSAGLASTTKKGACPWSIVLVGSKDDLDIVNYIEEQVKVVNLCGKLTLEETAAVIKNSDLYIGNDSALLYIASALGVKNLGIFGPTNPEILSPLDENSDYAVNKTQCHPCYHPKSTFVGEYKECEFDHKCMRELDFKAVYTKALDLLKINQAKIFSNNEQPTTNNGF